MQNFNKAERSTELSGSKNQNQMFAQLQLLKAAATDKAQILQKRQDITRQWVQEQQEQIKDRELDNCTFKPNVGTNKIINDWAVQTKYQNKDIISRLYSYENVQQKHLKQQISELEREKQQLQSCTFTPQTNKKYRSYSEKKLLFSGDDMVKNFDATVGRMRKALISSDIKKKLEQHIPCGEFYDQNKNKVFQPPSFLSRPKAEKQKPIYFIDVNIAPGRSGRIALYEQDDPKQVAENFARSFQLKEQTQQELEQLLETQLVLYNQQKLFNIQSHE